MLVLSGLSLVVNIIKVFFFLNTLNNGMDYTELWKLLNWQAHSIELFRNHG